MTLRRKLELHSSQLPPQEGDEKDAWNQLDHLALEIQRSVGSLHKALTPERDDRVPNALLLVRVTGRRRTWSFRLRDG
jgi:hypothetical protein